MEKLAAVETAIGYAFRDKGLLNQALTHRSLGEGHNQRLEFLGDSVLGLLIAEMLYAMYPAEAEGDLSKRLVSLVNGEQLAGIARGWGIGDALNLSHSEEEQGGRENRSNLEDACEALLGAAYLDGGLDAARGLIARFWQPHAHEMKAPPKDPKTTLQEWAQARGLPLPEYVVMSAEGPSHAPVFIIEVRVDGLSPARSEAGNKKLAERKAAEAMLAQVAG
jgi:ribonuclease-3